jgi:hypothetical protein
MSLRFERAWILECDADACRECVVGLGTTDTAQRRHATAEAELAGWSLSTHEQQKPDFCRLHAVSVRGAPVTRLYADGVALPYSRRST